MSKFSQYNVSDLARFRQVIDESLKKCTSMQGAAQKLADMVYQEFEETAVLFRVFGTFAAEKLPPPDRAFVKQTAVVRGCAEELNPKTLVVSLLGTRGKQPGWNDRYKSVNHLAIPLLSCSFIKTIPLVSVLVSDGVTGIDWINKQRPNILVKTLGQMAQLVYVDDASTDLTGEGFKTIPAQDFVWDNNIRTVIRLGGAYLEGTYVAVLIFTSEKMTMEDTKKFLPLINTFKTATTRLVMTGWFFD